MEISFPVLHLPVEALPFRDNLEFLEAKLAEYTLLLECALLRRAIQKEEVRASIEELSRQAVPGPDVEEEADCLNERLGKRAEEYRCLKAHNEGRLLCSGHVDLPFKNMAIRCGLNTFEQDVLWLLFFKATSPDFRQSYEEANFNRFGREFALELYIGNVLQLLCPGSLSAQMEACRHFAVDAPLLAHHLVRFGRDVQECTSILQVEVQLPQRVVAWISNDENTYAIDCPFRVERPEDLLEKVVLPQEQLDQVLSLVTHHETYLQKRKEWGLERTITYGRATAILEYGPPGTGKTLLARALACHTGRPLVLLNTRSQDTAGNEQDLEERLATLFREAQLRKGIVFIDECERLCVETSPVLRPLLTELEHTDALVIMATNRPELLAPALDRRFTLKVAFSLPDAEARLRIWENHLEGVPLDPKVDLGQLSAAYPFAGGYIKNAVLAAVNTALSRALNRDFLLGQEDLEMAARAQMRQVAGLSLHRELVCPQFALDQSLLPAAERTQVERLARIARNYRGAVAKARGQGPSIPNPERGFALLFCGASYPTGLRAAEALAGELQVLMSRVSLGTVLLDAGDRYPKEEGRPAQTGGQELFSAIYGADHLLVFTDEFGQLASLRGKDQDEGVRRFFSQLRSFEGLAVVVTACQRVALPTWARVFQERVCFDTLDLESRRAWWTALLGEAAHGLDIEGLAEKHALPLEQLQAAAHRAGLLAAAEGPGMEIGQEQLEAAIAALGTGLGRQGLLFG